MGFDIGGMFGDNSGGYGDYASAMREIAKRYDPYINRGNEAGDYLMGENQRLMENPNFVQDRIAGGWEASPYQRLLQGDVTSQMNMNAANNGMISSPLAQRSLNDRINGMTGQFMNDYVNRGMSSYGMGHQSMGDAQKLGLEGINQAGHYMGQGAGADLQGGISRNSMWGNIAGLGASAGLAAATGGASLGMSNWGQKPSASSSSYDPYSGGSGGYGGGSDQRGTPYRLW